VVLYDLKLAAMTPDERETFKYEEMVKESKRAGKRST
jgi:hypothetical protein